MLSAARTSKRPSPLDSDSVLRRRRGTVAGGLALLMLLVGLVGLGTAPASAGPVNAGWAAAGPGVVTTSDGSAAAAAMSYNADNTPGRSASWTFTSTATAASAAGPIRVPFTWQGLHAFFRVTALLQMTVNGVVVGEPLVQAGPTDCCTSPSNGFLYGGVATFNVNAGDVYGFRLAGSNADSNNFLRGTFTLSTKPYVDATIGKDNRQWVGAAALPAAGIAGTLNEPGEARWFRLPVVPGQQVTVDLTGLLADYDVALYGDIDAAFKRLSTSNDVTQLAAASAAGAPGSETQIPEYPVSLTKVPTTAAQLPSIQFAPRIYAPRIYAPRIYAPRIYAPRIYAPRIYAPGSYVPDLASDPAFRDAFSAAQNQTLLAVSANTGNSDEKVSASTGNTDGYFYVRVQGHTDSVSNAADSFQLNGVISGGTACAGLQDYFGTSTLAVTRTDARTVIATDTNKLGLTKGTPEYSKYLGSLASLAGAGGTDGAIVDVGESARVRALQAQAAGHVDCPYAVNLVARAIKDIIDSYRNAGSRYVVIAGGDDVIPFFRYPDVSGLGQESQFSPPLLPDSAAGASLLKDQVLSQDAYGSSTEVTIGGATLPVPDLAVGRLVKTPDEIQSTITNYLELTAGTLPVPTSSLVTGYDFLADAATRVNTEFTAALPGGRNDTLIAPSGEPLSTSWKGSDLEAALLGSRHDLVYLAGHFSANDTLAADFATTFDADLLDPSFQGGVNADKLKNTIVLSAGCHSGYSIVDGAATSTTNSFDWTQRMAQQHAVLIGGTGYQYGDTDFLEYSERLYLNIARRLHEGPSTGAAEPVAVGRALVLAKQDYLASLGTVTGIDQKAVLQATLYGIPMTGFDAPGRKPFGAGASRVPPQKVTSGPGATLGLGTDDLALATTTDRGTKASGAGAGLPSNLSWLNGADGVAVQPGAPALPKQIEDVTVTGQVLRGVGFRGGDYIDTPGLLPLTGAPAIEGSTANTTFESPAFFPQRLATPNYFGALGASGRTSLVLTPAQYRSDRDALTNTERGYSGMNLRLFYSGAGSASYGTNQPAIAAPPSIGEVKGTVRDGLVTFSARATGDPSAGVQQVWVTYTGGTDASGAGTWRSVDLTQDDTDSTRWSGTLRLAAGQATEEMRFIVQAANGIGAVGLDTAEGDGYRVTAAGADSATVSLFTKTPSTSSPFGVTASVNDDQGTAVAGRAVRFTVSRAGLFLFTSSGTSTTAGSVELVLPTGQQLPSGRISVRAELLDNSGGVQSTALIETVIAGVQVVTTPAFLTTRAGTTFPVATPLTATLTDARGPLAGVPVTFTLPITGARATFPDSKSSVTVNTDSNGLATARTATAGPTVGAFAATISTEGATSTAVPMAAQYALTPFLSPFSGSQLAVTSPTGTTPLKTSALLADNTRLSDPAAAALVSSGRLQVRWRQVVPAGTTPPPWTTRAISTRYDAVMDFFQADLKASNLGWVKGKTYEVNFRLLPANTEPQPVGDALQSSFDLGSRSARVQVK